MDSATERARSVIDREYDVVVIGGGVAGTCAAISAARMGSRVALVHDRPVLGGNSSSEIRVWAIGAATQGHFRNARETGIIEELTLEAAYRSQGLPPIYAEPYPMWETVLKEWCDREPTLDLYLNTRAFKVEVANNRILSVGALQTSTERAFCLRAEVFIESSGDGEIGHLAGAAWRMGQESRAEFGECLAPEEATARILPSTLLFSTRSAGRPVPFEPPEWAYDFPREEDLPFRDHRYVKSGYWWISMGGDIDTINDNEAIRDELHRILFGVWDHIKNHGDHGADHLVLDWVGQVVGKRESRRFEGDCIVTQDDVLEGTVFPDAIAYGGWPLDLHPSEGFFSSDVPTDQIEVVKPYTIPYRAIYSRNIENLLLSGRLISASHIAMGTIRVQKTLSLVGQAAGIAAHYCAARRITPREVGQRHIPELQQELLKHGCFIPHAHNQDPADLAREAAVTGTGSMQLPEIEASGKHALAVPHAQKFVISEGRVVRIHVKLFSEHAAPVQITGILHSSQELWDFRNGEVVVTSTVSLPAHHDGWVAFEFNQIIDPACPYWLEITAAPGVAWYHSDEEPVGCQAAVWSSQRIVRLGLDGPPPRNALQEETLGGIWRFLRGTFLFQLEPRAYPYPPQNVISGVTRPECGTNLWVSDPEAPSPHWLELAFPEPVQFDTLHITFDSDLDRQMDEGARVLTGPIPEIMREYSVYSRTGENWKLILSEHDNHQRRRVHHFSQVTSSRIRIEFPIDQQGNVSSTASGPLELNRDDIFPDKRPAPKSARVFEVRIYDTDRHPTTGDSESS